MRHCINYDVVVRRAFAGSCVGAVFIPLESTLIADLMWTGSIARIERRIHYAVERSGFRFASQEARIRKSPTGQGSIGPIR